MIDYFKIQEGTLEKFPSNCNGAIVGFMKNSEASKTIATRWKDCAMHQECIAPRGSNRSNHRQDQAALTLLVQSSPYNHLCSIDYGNLPISIHNDKKDFLFDCHLPLDQD